MACAIDVAGNTTSVTSGFSVSTEAQIRSLELPAGYSGATKGLAINSSGQVAEEVDLPGGTAKPVRWDADGKATVLYSGQDGVPPYCFCHDTLATGINDAGDVVGRLPGGGAKWHADGTVERLTSATGTLSSNDRPMAINNAGTVTGESGADHEWAWGTWTGTSFTALAIPLAHPSIG